jgi:hypothetical protein
LLDLVGFSDADFAGRGIDRKSTSDTCHFLGSSLVCWSASTLLSCALNLPKIQFVFCA